MNGIFLVFIALSVLLESVERMLHPEEMNTDKLLLVSVLGLLVNLVGVFAFHDLHAHGDDDDAGEDHGGHAHSHGGHSHGSHAHAHEGSKGGENVYGACVQPCACANVYAVCFYLSSHRCPLLLGVYLHIIADTLGSVSVIVSSLLIQFFGWTIADPICSFGMSVLIFVSVIPLIKGSATTLLQCTPPVLDAKMQGALQKVCRSVRCHHVSPVPDDEHRCPRWRVL